MIEVTIYQKDMHGHTKFVLLPGVRIFGEENFDIAKGWLDRGLLCEKSHRVMEAIIKCHEGITTLREIAEGFRIAF